MLESMLGMPRNAARLLAVWTIGRGDGRWRGETAAGVGVQAHVLCGSGSQGDGELQNGCWLLPTDRWPPPRAALHAPVKSAASAVTPPGAGGWAFGGREETLQKHSATARNVCITVDGRRPRYSQWYLAAVEVKAHTTTCCVANQIPYNTGHHAEVLNITVPEGEWVQQQYGDNCLPAGCVCPRLQRKRSLYLSSTKMNEEHAALVLILKE
jgi:hypothetical protein